MNTFRRGEHVMAEDRDSVDGRFYPRHLTCTLCGMRFEEYRGQKVINTYDTATRECSSISGNPVVDQCRCTRHEDCLANLEMARACWLSQAGVAKTRS